MKCGESSVNFELWVFKGINAKLLITILCLIECYEYYRYSSSPGAIRSFTTEFPQSFSNERHLDIGGRGVGTKMPPPSWWPFMWGGSLNNHCASSHALAAKLKALKEDLKVWSKEVFRNVTANRKLALNQISFWDEKESEGILSIEEREATMEPSLGGCMSGPLGGSWKIICYFGAADLYAPFGVQRMKHSLGLDFMEDVKNVYGVMGVRGMMYYRKALMLQSYLERNAAGDVEAAISSDVATDTQGYEFSPAARALADLKFTYVVTCQIYGIQREEQKPEAVDIALLMQRNEALRVAYIDSVETLKDGIVQTEFYSKLVKADINGKDQALPFWFAPDG
ncbi:Callose synthase 9 [Vitis vinifera]|uniref:Callose synthase 9 n=1 Tax=Vitis vinifera TaxID=29760 RepID=A0A438ELM0_VITVI|nr:Callose synthase 9 [Vitis vinifera]